MLRHISLKAFKCFASFESELQPLSILSGVNGGGKSSLIQAIVLLHQALVDGGSGGLARTEVPLSGSALALGSVRDVVNTTLGGRELTIELSTAEIRAGWTLRGGESPSEDLAPRIQRMAWRTAGAEGEEAAARPSLIPGELLEARGGRALQELLAGLVFVPADRLGPSEVYPLLEPARHRSFGRRAERAVGALLWRRDDEVARPELLHPSLPSDRRLVRQVERWVGDLFPGAVLDLQRIAATDLATLGIRTDESAEFHRPQNVGFGMTYLLPVVVALVGANPGDVVVLENPEAHLHPSAQVRIADLVVCAVNAGVQVIVETHSDHVLNGVRVAVHQRRLRADQVGIHFFGVSAGDERGATHELVKIRKDGRLSHRPPGFFDETERQLTALMEPTSDDDE